MSQLDRIIIEHLQAFDEEEQEACIHCHKRWYKTHHVDGVCKWCKSQGKPGRTEIEQSDIEGWKTVVAAVAVGAMVICYLCW